MSLTRCLKKVGLSEHEEAILRGNMADIRDKDQVSAKEAAVSAVQMKLDELTKERADVVQQMGKAIKPTDLTEVPGTYGNARRPLVFNSGSQMVGDFTKLLANLKNVGINIMEMSMQQLDRLGAALASSGENYLFVDSGAFPVRMKFLRTGDATLPKSVDFAKVFERYDRLAEAISKADEDGYANDRVFYVMPDAVGDQQESLKLMREWADKVKTYMRSTNAIVPLQDGEMSLTQYYDEVAKILGRDDLLVGIPSQADAVPNEKVIAFLKERGDKVMGVHILGGASKTRLEPRINALKEAGYDGPVSADAHLTRTLWNSRGGVTRAEALDKAAAAPEPVFKRGEAPQEHGIVFEVAPNPDNVELTKRWDALSFEQKREATQHVARQTIGRLLRDLQIPVKETEYTVGAFLGHANPSIIVRFPKSVSLAQALNAGKEVRFVLQQQSVIAYDESIKTGDGITGFVKVELPGGLTQEQELAIYSEIFAAYPQAEGFTGHHGVPVFANLSDDSNVSFRDTIAGVVDRLHPELHFTVSLHEFRSDYIDADREARDASQDQGTEAGRDSVRRWAGNRDSLRQVAAQVLEGHIAEAESEREDAARERQVDELDRRGELTGEEVSLLRSVRGRVKRFVNLLSQIPALPDEFEHAALAGLANRGWYQRTREAIEQFYGLDSRRFLTLMAALSPQTDVKSNFFNAARVWSAWLRADRTTDEAALRAIFNENLLTPEGAESGKDAMDAWVNNGLRTLQSANDTAALSGPKVESFRRNLLGDAYEVTNDRHMANFAGIVREFLDGLVTIANPLLHKSPGYTAMNTLTRRAANALTLKTGERWSPAEVQETIWSFWKALDDLARMPGQTKTAVQLLRDGDLTHEMVARVPDLGSFLYDEEYRDITQGERQGRGVSPAAASELLLASRASAQTGPIAINAALERVAQRVDDRIAADRAEAQRKLEEKRAAAVTEEVDPDADIPGFKRGPGVASTAKRALQVGEYIEPYVTSLGNPAPVHVLNSVADAQHWGFSAPADARGAFWHGQVFLFAENIPDRLTAQSTIYHELRGHYGLRGAFGRGLGQELAKLYALNPSIRAASAKWLLANPRPEGVTAYDWKMLSMEEALSDVAGTGAKINGLKRFVAVLQNLLRKVGLHDVAAWLEKATDAQALTMLARADQYTQAGKLTAIDRTNLAPAMTGPAPIWRSQLSEAIAAKAPFGKDGTIKANQLIAWLEARSKDGTVKQAELEWSGLTDYLWTLVRPSSREENQNARISRDDVQNWLAQNGVQVEEVMLSDRDYDEWRAQREKLDADIERLAEERRQEYAANGNSARYQELDQQVATLHGQRQRRLEESYGRATQYKKYVEPGGDDYRELLFRLPGSPLRSKFDAPHFGEHSSNLLAHVRFDTRYVGGKKVLFIEEIQSDWAQHGRDEGFKRPVDSAEVKRLRAELDAAMKDQEAASSLRDRRNRDVVSAREKITKLTHVMEKHPDAAKRREAENDLHAANEMLFSAQHKQFAAERDWAAIDRRVDELQRAVDAAEHPRGMERAPFVEKTEAWVNLVLKRMIRYAADNGFQTIAWTTGQQQADRYNLSKVVDKIEWEKTPEADKQFGVLTDRYIKIYPKNGTRIGITVDSDGKVLSGRDDLRGHRLDEVIGKELAQRVMAEEQGEAEAEGLKVGGGGMRSFYDQIVPSLANKLIAKLGGEKVTGVPLNMKAKGELTIEPWNDGYDRNDHHVARKWAVYEEGWPKRLLMTFKTRQQAQGYIDYLSREREQKTAQMGFEITPKMKELAQAGLPMFARKEGLGPWNYRDLDTRNYWQEVQELPEYKAAVAEEEAARKALNERRVELLGMEAQKLKEDPAFLRLVDGMNEGQIENLARVMFNARGEVGANLLMPYTERLNEARRATARIPQEYFEREAGPYSPYGDAARQARDYYSDPDFRAWFKQSKAVDRAGNPLVAFHGTTNEFETFDPLQRDQPQEALKKNPGYTGRIGTWFAAPSLSQESYDPGNAEFTAESVGGTYARDGKAMIKNPEDSYEEWVEGAQVMPVHLSIQNPMEYYGWEHFAEDRNERGYMKDALAFRNSLIAEGYDGIVIRDSSTDGGQFRDDWIAFYPNQIKSALGRLGPWSQTDDRAVYSRAPAVPAHITPEQEQSLRKIGVLPAAPATLRERFNNWRHNLMLRMIAGTLDSYHAIAQAAQEDPAQADAWTRAYKMLRMTRSSDAVLEAVLKYGKISANSAGGVSLQAERGGFIGAMNKLVGDEVHLFFAWVAANRAEQLTAEDREHLFGTADIAALKKLNEGNMADGRSRKMAYAQALAKYNEYGKSILDFAQANGMFNAEQRAQWEKEFYVPFNRVQEDGTITGPHRAGGAVNQYAFKRLKGGTAQLNDLTDNVLNNWYHLIDASMKNGASAKTLDLSEKAGVARRVPAAAAGKGMPFVLVNGEKVYYEVQDPFILEAITALQPSPINGPIPRAMAKFKHALTYGVTSSPAFRARNLIRDSIQAIAANPVGYNIGKNLVEGWQLTDPNNPMFQQAFTGGALMHFGAGIDTEHGLRVKQLIAKGVDAKTILDSPEKVKEGLKSALEWWEETGSRGENVNRMAIYKQTYERMLAAGKTQDEAAFEAAFAARDSMDFSMMGAWPWVRALAQVVPFMNARAQGLYKIGREGIAPTARVLTGRGEAGDVQKALRFNAVTGTVALASIALLLLYKDDDDWKRREEWDRDNFWWFKAGDTAYRIPKPFEVGALASVAERGLEAMMDGMDAPARQRFASRIWALLMDNLSMNPTPQVVKPIIDIYANVDSFTQRPIETPGMENLLKSERIGPNTSVVAQQLGKLTAYKNTGLSPAQIDQLIQGYLGWLGAHAVLMSDWALRPALGYPSQPSWKLDDYMRSVGMGGFASSLPQQQSRWVSQFYDQSTKVHEVMATARNFARFGQADRAIELLRDNPDERALYPMYQRASEQMTALNGYIKQVQQSGMGADEKRQKLDQLFALKNSVAQRVEEVRLQRARQ